MSTQSECNNRGKYLTRIRIPAFILIVLIFSTGAVAVADSSLDSANYGWFKVDSTPASGEVIFDGISYGYAPAMIKVDTDALPSHELVVKMDGYEEYSQQILYNPGKGETVPIVLDATHTLDNIVEFLQKN